MNALLEEFQREVAACQAIIGYQPLSDEIGFRDVPWLDLSAKPVLLLPTDKLIDPFMFARMLSKQFAGQRVLMLVPGRQFDERGTRHGRGLGWYDRFLSSVPREWIRVGVLTENELSLQPLARNEWDEAMDWLMIKDTQGWRVRLTKEAV